MSKRAVEQVLMRVLGDGDFRGELQAHAENALAPFDLSDAEREAIITANRAALLDFGVDKRLVQMLPPSIFQV